jgi:hypothetical protein
LYRDLETQAEMEETNEFMFLFPAFIIGFAYRALDI